jgi:hypothetical protein
VCGDQSSSTLVATKPRLSTTNLKPEPSAKGVSDEFMRHNIPDVQKLLDLALEVKTSKKLIEGKRRVSVSNILQRHKARRF